MRSHDQEGPKKFDVVFRGYARGPVDEYVARLHEWLVDCEARAENAMQNAAAGVGDRVSEILKAAFEVGEEARQTSEKDAVKLLEQAEQRAAEVLHFAERRAEQLRERAEATLAEAEKVKTDAVETAQAEAERTLEEAHQRYDALEDSIKELSDRKAKALGELSRLQDYLAGVPEVRPVDAAGTKPDIEPTEANGARPVPQASPAAG